MPDKPLRDVNDFRAYFEERRAAIERRMAEAGFPVKIVPGTGGMRSAAQQAAIFQRGRTPGTGAIATGLDGVTKISHHQAGTGVDYMFVGKPNYPLLGKISKQEGMTWGGDWRELDGKPFSDPAHVQLGANLPGTSPGDHPVPLEPTHIHSQPDLHVVASTPIPEWSSKRFPPLHPPTSQVEAAATQAQFDKEVAGQQVVRRAPAPVVGSRLSRVTGGFPSTVDFSDNQKLTLDGDPITGLRVISSVPIPR